MGLSQPQFAHPRKYPRYNCTCGVEVRTSDAQSGYWGTLADICLGGCYVTTFSPLPAGTSVVLKFDAPSGEILLNGETVTFHPGVGMGIQFADSAGEEKAHLKTWLESLDTGS
jgi:PilZ domain